MPPGRLVASSRFGGVGRAARASSTRRPAAPTARPRCRRPPARHRTGCPCSPGTPDRSTRAGCARAPSTRTRRSRSTTGRRSPAGGTGRPSGRDPTRRLLASVIGVAPPRCSCSTGVKWRSASDAHRRPHERGVARRLARGSRGARVGGRAHPRSIARAQRAPAGVDVVDRRARAARRARARSASSKLGPEPVGLPQVLEEAGDALGAGRGEVVGERGDARRRGGRRARRRRPSDRSAVVGRRASGGGSAHALGLGQRLAEHAACAACCTSSCHAISPARRWPRRPGERADGGAALGEHAEVAEACGVDAEPAQPLVVGEARLEIGEPLERVAHEHPREVVVEVAPVRELPVGDRDELGRRRT